MTTVLIFAGGKSTRMREDKSTMFGGVKRIRNECDRANVSRIITLCGSEDRMKLFDGEVWVDPIDSRGVLDVVRWSVREVGNDILLIPCDGFNITKLGINKLVEQENCVPIDGFGNRQPLFARISNPEKLVWEASTLTGLLGKFPDYENIALSSEFNNFNQRSDLKSRHLQ